MKKWIIGMLTFISLCVLGMAYASACPVISEPETHRLSNGYTMTETAYGDEYLNYSVTKDGYVVRFEDGFWYHQTVASCMEKEVRADKLVSAGFRYGIDPVPPLALKEENLQNYENLNYRQTIAENRAAAQPAAAL